VTERAVITGAGPLVFAGAGREAFLRAFGAPPPAAAEITGFECPDGAPSAAYELTDFTIEKYTDVIQSYIDRASALAAAGAKLALADAGLLDPAGRAAPVGLAYATTWGCLDSMKRFYSETARNPKLAPPLPFSHSYANSPSSIAAILFELRGFAVTLSSGATCGLAAVAAAAQAIRDGTAGIVLAGASEALTEPLYRHALAAGMLSREGRLSPDSGGGTVLGEGAAFVVIESKRSAKTRGAKILAALECFSAGRFDAAGSIAEAARAAGNVDEVFRCANGQAEGDAAERRGLDEAGLGGVPQRFIKTYTGEAFSVSPVAGVIAALGGQGRRLVVAGDAGGAAEAVMVKHAEDH
jgi:3-oxoacyl-(acyl-carrier-protein) synthase